ncbi:MAG: hypothetical protein VKN33_06235 [Candidatus Sericytochromatia bacterium]|nr:hypothetical protein [Candidatus Sericytochromatia bacterium]
MWRKNIYSLSGRVSLCLSLVSFFSLSAHPAEARNPAHPPFREAKADFHDKELALTYAWGGPAALDFALLPPITLGASVDHVLQPRSWAYRGVWKLVDERQTGIGIAFTGAATQIREIVAGEDNLSPVWGWQAGMLTTLLLEGGLIVRLGVQAYDTDIQVAGGQSVLLSPEIAYRLGLVELAVVPRWPLNDWGWEWIGARIRL